MPAAAQRPLVDGTFALVTQKTPQFVRLSRGRGDRYPALARRSSSSHYEAVV